MEGQNNPGGAPREPQASKPASQNPWAGAGIGMMIPSLMVSGPLVGYGLGWLIRRATGWGHWVEIVMTLVGMIAGVRESIIAIRKISK